MTDTKVIKSDDGELLFAVGVDKQYYYTMDVFYTISQNYKEVLVYDNVYLNKNYPMSTMTLSLCEGDTDAADSLERSGTELYFDARGVFLFKGESDPNPDRAVKEFLALVEDKQLILGPMLTVGEVMLDELIVEEDLGGKKTLFMYKD